MTTTNNPNTQAHADIEREMSKLKNTWYHFEIRTSNGNIVDFVTREYVTYDQNKPTKESVAHDHR